MDNIPKTTWVLDTGGEAQSAVSTPHVHSLRRKLQIHNGLSPFSAPPDETISDVGLSVGQHIS